jgi:hypothetical protein
VVAMKWGLSILDWRQPRHRRTPHASHRGLQGRVRPLLMMVTTLHEVPYGKACEACAGQQFARAVSS